MKHKYSWNPFYLFLNFFFIYYFFLCSWLPTKLHTQLFAWNNFCALSLHRTECYATTSHRQRMNELWMARQPTECVTLNVLMNVLINWFANVIHSLFKTNEAADAELNCNIYCPHKSCFKSCCKQSLFKKKIAHKWTLKKWWLTEKLKCSLDSAQARSVRVLKTLHSEPDINTVMLKGWDFCIMVYVSSVMLQTFCEKLYCNYICAV